MQSQQITQEPKQSEPAEIETDSEEQRQFQRIKASSKKLTLIPQWFKSTTQTINKMNTQLKSISVSRKYLQQQLNDLQTNRKNFQKLSQLKQDVYQYTYKHRNKNVKLIQILHPMLMVEIYQYVSHEPYLWILKHRRVSSYFQNLYNHDYIIDYFSSRLLGPKYSQELRNNGELQKTLKGLTKQYVFFRNNFKYYKEQNYWKVLPHNSFLNDLILSLRFVNKIFQLALDEPLQYQAKINKFLITNHGIIAFQSLASMDIPILQMNALQAFINHIAVNPFLKQKKEIQSKELKLLLTNDQTKIHVYFNTRITQIMHQNGYDLALLKTHKKNQIQLQQKVKVLIITPLSENVLEFQGQIRKFKQIKQIIGSNYHITLENDNLLVHIDKDQLPGILTFALINNQLKQIYVYLNENNCLIVDPCL